MENEKGGCLNCGEGFHPSFFNEDFCSEECCLSVYFNEFDEWRS